MNDHKLNVLLTVHRNTSVYQDQQDALFVFSLLWIKNSYMFRALFAHHQEAVHKQSLYCVRIILAGYYQVWSGTPTML
jgi:hypothetical protein